MIGIKGFEENLCCRGMQYEVGKTYTKNNPKGTKLRCCSDTVYHFCDSLSGVHEFYNSENEYNRFCEVEALGEIVQDGAKYGTDKIRIIREITGDELNRLKGKVNGNTGLFNSGNSNSGDRNSGDSNSGDRNSGNWNSGYRNSGNWNSGDRNSGYRNSGNWNSGDWNSGDWNSGDWNSGNWNSCNYESGCFNTKQSTIRMFNKPSNITYMYWINCRARRILSSMPQAIKMVIWTDKADMTDEEKEKHKDCDVVGGFLKEEMQESNVQKWWNDLDNDEKQTIKDLPNFDSGIFKKITGVDVDAN